MKIDTQSVSVFDVRIAPDQQRFACALVSAPVKVFALPDGEELLAVKDAHYDSAWSVDWLKEKSKTYLLAGYGENGYLRILDDTGKNVLKYSTRSSDFGYPDAAQLHTDSIQCIRVVGQELISVAHNGSMVKFPLEQAKTGTFKFKDSLLHYKKLKSTLRDVCLWQDGQVFVCNDAGKILLIDLKKWTNPRSWVAHDAEVISLAKLNHDLLISAGWDDKIKVWNVAEKAVVREFEVSESVNKVFALNGKIVHNDGPKILVKDAESFATLQEINSHESEVLTFDLTRDGKTLVSGDDEGMVCITSLH